MTAYKVERDGYTVTFDFKTPEELEDAKEAIFDKFIKDQSNLYVREVIQILAWFHDRFPNHHLKWMDGMGTDMWIINDEIWDCDTYFTSHVSSIGKTRYLKERGWTRKEILLKPLVDFQKSINNCTYCHDQGVQIGGYEIDRESGEIVEC